MNPTINTNIIERATESDPEAARSEWLAEFRSDIAQFLDDAVIDDAIDAGRPLELPPQNGINYVAFVDSSGGAHDSFCIGIAHKEGECVTVDVIRGRHPPFDPNAVAQEFADLARQYRCTQVTGDAYSKEWVATSFRNAGVAYRQCEVAKSGLYLEMLPHFTRGVIRIPDHPRLVPELRRLERRVTRSGKDSVDHGPSGADDHANVLAGSAFLLRERKGLELPSELTPWGVKSQKASVVTGEPTRPDLDADDDEPNRVHTAGLGSYVSTNPIDQPARQRHAEVAAHRKECHRRIVAAWEPVRLKAPKKKHGEAACELFDALSGDVQCTIRKIIDENERNVGRMSEATEAALRKINAYREATHVAA
jgi:hypothetical protein